MLFTANNAFMECIHVKVKVFLKKGELMPIVE